MSSDMRQIQTSLKIPFDGGENEARWMACGMPKGAVPDQFVEKCSGGGKNLHIYKLGFYWNCGFCEKQEHCRDVSDCAGEQGGL